MVSLIKRVQWNRCKYYQPKNKIKKRREKIKIKTFLQYKNREQKNKNNSLVRHFYIYLAFNDINHNISYWFLVQSPKNLYDKIKKTNNWTGLATQPVIHP